MGNMTEGDSPQGSGTVRAMITAQERATLSIATRGSRDAGRSARGGSAPDKARVKADSLTPAFP